MTDVIADFSRYRFLVVDDSAQIRRLVSSMLKRCNSASVLQSCDGAEAMHVLESRPDEIDCVVCDWNMEPMDGLSFLKAIRTGESKHISRDIRFIMLTGHSELDVVKAALTSDVSGFLVKPVSMKKLIKTVESVMGKKLSLQPAEHYAATPNIPLPNSDMRALCRTEERANIDSPSPKEK